MTPCVFIKKKRHESIYYKQTRTIDLLQIVHLDTAGAYRDK